MEHEIRSIKGELRSAPGFKLEGLAARYGSRSIDLGGFIETIAPGAFTRSLKSATKVVVTKNHDPNFVLGSTKSGTAKVFDSAEGLRFTVQLDATNTMHADTYNSVKRGDLDACSFAFRVPAGGDSFTPTKDAAGAPIALRTLKDVDLVDVAIACYPAYPQGTQVDARSLTAKGLLRVAPVPAHLAEGADYERLVRAAIASGLEITKQATADLRARARYWERVIQEDGEQFARDEELRKRMENAAGRTCR